MSSSTATTEPAPSNVFVEVSSFSNVAPYYDELMAGVPYRFWVEYVVSLFRSHGQSPASILDLGCGTGSAAALFRKRGYDVAGADKSPHMIAVARQKAEHAGIDIPYHAQDAAELDLPARFDAAVSLFDSLNNIVEADRLSMAFDRVYRHLNNPGIFVFDLNTEVAFSDGMFDQKSNPLDGPLQYVWRSSYNPESRLCTVRMSFRFHAADGSEERSFEETHVQRAYGKDEVKHMLTRAGFDTVAVYDAYTLKPPKKRSDRLFFVAGKTPTAQADAG
jgi:ubiquinone/menaquinone biosynthesis C-methylase UbiE